jgi:hypothetical protein
MKRASLPLLLFCTCIAAAPAPTPAPKVQDIVESYAKLPRMTKDPYAVSPTFLANCGTFSLNSQDEATRKHGDHAYTSIHVFMDESARDAFQKGAEYPIGAVIVKEKNNPNLRVDDPHRRVALGGMIKRKSSSPSNVDNWEFFYIDENKKLATEKDLQRCKDCHTNAAKKDFVFGDWSKVSEPAMKKL